MNHVILTGRLGRDPESRSFPSGDSVVTFSLATDESYTDREGQRCKKTDWHRITVFGRQGENCVTYLHKGSQVLVDGAIHYRQWKDQQGVDHTMAEIRARRVEFLDSRAAGAHAPAAESGYAAPARQAAPASRAAGGTAKPAARRSQQADPNEDLGPVFPAEAAAMDEVPF